MLTNFVFFFLFSSVIDKYFGLEFESETKCVETEDEPASITTERHLQYNCYIDKDVKYLATGLSNVIRFVFLV